MSTTDQILVGLAAYLFWPTVAVLAAVASRATWEGVRQWRRNHDRALIEDRQVARLEALFDYDEIAAEEQPDELERLWTLPCRRPVA